MKIKLVTHFYLVMSLLLILSCGESDDPDTQESIVASWKGTTIIEGNEQNLEPDINITLELTFGSDGTGNFKSSYVEDITERSYNSDFTFVVDNETFVMDYELTLDFPCEPGSTDCSTTIEESLTSTFIIDENQLTINNWIYEYNENTLDGDKFTSIMLEKVN